MSSTKLWGGRFAESTDEAVERFSASIETDRHIAEDDVEGSIAHAEMLGAVGLVSAEDAARLVFGLRAIQAELAAGKFPWDPALEDVHMNVEQRLGALIGEDIAGRLHTARSRNDQVALDERLFLRRRLGAIRGQLAALELALIDQAEQHVGTLLPGYTHLQRAQPVRLAHHLLAHREALARDRGRIDDLLVRALVSPLGSGAIAGTTHPIDRQLVAEKLALYGVSANSMDATADRDSLLEAMSAAAISMVHLSRFAEELVLWSTLEFGFIEIGDAFTTGSSMMPQKKNPDVAELVRGKTGRVIGDLVALLVTLKGLPLAYNRDLQEDKPALIDSLDTWEACLDVLARMVPAIRFDVGRMRRALDDGFVTATELADHLVSNGVPFREAHAVVGRIVLECIRSHRRLADLSVEDYRGFHAAFGADVIDWVDPERAVERRRSAGAPAETQVRGALARARAELEALR
ncbi:MAG: argininosuccinate lyase [Deltaproteobacteria bacterium]|nr:argininosuccinate lyase [Deltaproteobacteria bacterium]